MGSGFISRSDDVPDLIAEGRPRPTEDGQPYLKEIEYRVQSAASSAESSVPEGSFGARSALR
jgi:hypothetical protein